MIEMVTVIMTEFEIRHLFQKYIEEHRQRCDFVRMPEVILRAIF